MYAGDDERHKLEEEQRAAAARRIQACVASLRLFAFAIATCSDPCVTLPILGKSARGPRSTSPPHVQKAAGAFVSRILGDAIEEAA